MCVNQLQLDTVLVTDVAGRVETAVAERWKVPGFGLKAQIDALRRRGVNSRVIKMLHYMREERNRVIHHPRRELADRPKFEEFAVAALPVIEESVSPEDLTGRISGELDRLILQLRVDLTSDLPNLSDLKTSLADEILSIGPNRAR